MDKTAPLCLQYHDIYTRSQIRGLRNSIRPWFRQKQHLCDSRILYAVYELRWIRWTDIIESPTALLFWCWSNLNLAKKERLLLFRSKESHFNERRANNIVLVSAGDFNAWLIQEPLCAGIRTCRVFARFETIQSLEVRYFLYKSFSRSKANSFIVSHYCSLYVGLI